VPYKEPEIKKLYYTIGEVSEMFHVNASLIRFWENEFDVLKPKKNNKGNRLFTPEDIEHLKVIYNLVKYQGFTLEGAKKYLKENKKQIRIELKNGKDHFSEIERRLLEIKSRLIKLRELL
jgi:DNA-binding transcriptional MerR regulator